MDIKEALKLYDLPLPDMTALADRARRDTVGNRMKLCTISNAKSGKCPEDCKFCAQSIRYDTDVAIHPLKKLAELKKEARRAREIGSDHFGIVTSGKALTDSEVKFIAEAVSAIKRDEDIEVCASLGCLSRDQLVLLRESGLTRYNHDIETSPRYFPKVITSHRFEDRLQTVRWAVEAGLSICCGGIIGMGETREDRVGMALTIRDLSVDSVPLNVLIPIPGTPFEKVEPISIAEALKTVALFRLIMPDKTIKLAAGREKILGDFQGMAFMAGANSMIIGGYLTLQGREVAEDKTMVEEIHKAWSG